MQLPNRSFIYNTFTIFRVFTHYKQSEFDESVHLWQSVWHGSQDFIDYGDKYTKYDPIHSLSKMHFPLDLDLYFININMKILLPNYSNKIYFWRILDDSLQDLHLSN
jgi:hypothetical protein